MTNNTRQTIAIAIAQLTHQTELVQARATNIEDSIAIIADGLICEIIVRPNARELFRVAYSLVRAQLRALPIGRFFNVR